MLLLLKVHVWPLIDRERSLSSAGASVTFANGRPAPAAISRRENVKRKEVPARLIARRQK
jgi:hypothetical protein